MGAGAACSAPQSGMSATTAFGHASTSLLSGGYHSQTIQSPHLRSATFALNGISRIAGAVPPPAGDSLCNFVELLYSRLQKRSAALAYFEC